MNNPVSIWTPFNRKPTRSTPDTRRVFNEQTGRWEKIDPKAASVLGWLKGDR